MPHTFPALLGEPLPQSTHFMAKTAEVHLAMVRSAIITPSLNLFLSIALLVAKLETFSFFSFLSVLTQP